MQWKLTEEQEAYRKTFRDWLAAAAPSPKVRQWLDAEDDSAFEDRFAAEGWAGVGLPEDLGGQGGGLVELALTAEELARAAVPSAAWLANVLAAPALAGRRDLAEAALSGEATALLVPAELVPQEAPLLRVDTDGAITGRAPRVLAGDTATRFVVPVVGDGATRELRLAEASAPGVGLTARPLLDRSRSVADVTFDRVPSVRLDVDVDEVLRGASVRAGVLVAADSLGAGERMLDLAVEYSKQRHQFGVPIGSFQAVKHAAATILVGVEAARSAVYFAAASVEADAPQSLLHAAAVKAQVTAEGVRTADSALTLHGAIGYTWEHDLQLFFKRAKLDEKLYGSPQAWNELLADGLALV
ncbi:acyl-CoA dehydrogenase [Streptomyces albus]|uniref:Acyl-CoA dehydrogenase n=1 Tax=Streptomyces albus (strain ATCC 21838 / DSM 41398 / FERM P-419 / JCM 4703 / NBRC 107858) TaxID=1081613 RepID=A0A0B5F8X5_STRA4|nr:acyl-CoA dehydrogenase [Streptomyces albus]AOU81614.1 acyl-CoA dehydrogenase [Streptomyces albus]AYN37306.1 acyl-CoA dehydrogenase [Streptomyces albus]